ncbi:response regulator [Limimaricola pyoseonensis]|uniref:Response regulator receiver domain-containing protein n=1 Tax=Limimaricola pyoseonensis TaxID=521013 RepID=A0A1G6ZN22_9RHOB|nr:response regulator [Limimaricola pyoseonensis]SDE04204.1 Response regulator receiver domain-containing protein [Limimaricola pyoseonensis]
MAKILLVEDELLIGWDIKDTLEEAGHEVDGPYATVAEALERVERALPEIGFLDVRLADGEVDPLADRLQAQDVRLVFHSGHIRALDHGRRYPGCTVCAKPSTPDELVEAVAQQVARRKGGGLAAE